MKSALQAFLYVALAAGAARADEWNKQWQVGGTPEVHVSASDASLRLEAGATHGVEATIRTTGWVIGSSGVRVIEHQSGNRIDLEVKEPNTHFNFGNHSIEIVVRVPREVTGYLHTGDGSVKMEGLHGSIRADTGDGSIDANDLDGMLRAHSGDGSVHARERFDGLEIQTSDGSVDVSALPGSRMKEDWKMQTGDGSIRLALPHDLPANLDLRTGDGSIKLNLEITTSGIKSEHEVRGKLNGGGPELALHTGDGSIQVDPI